MQLKPLHSSLFWQFQCALLYTREQRVCVCMRKAQHKHSHIHKEQLNQSHVKQLSKADTHIVYCFVLLARIHIYCFHSFFCWFRSGLFMTISIELELHTTFDYFKNESEYWEIDGINWTLSTFLGNSLNFFEISFLREKERQQHPHL